MSSRQFWALSLREFLYAVDGYASSRGVKRKGKGARMTHKRLLDLAEKYPDTPNPRARAA